MPKKLEPMKAKTMSIADAVSEAMGEIQSLAEEMRSWADNMEEKLSHTDKYERVSEAADTLEGINEPDIPDNVSDVTVEYTDLRPKKRGHSRANRCGQAVYILDTCIDMLNEIADDEDNAKKELKKLNKDRPEAGKISLEDFQSDASDLRDEIESAKDEAEGVEFPGMYG